MNAKRITYLFVIAALAAFAFYGFSRPSWETQFAETSAALKSAKSWNARISEKISTGTMETVEEVSCPKTYHIVEHRFKEDGSPASPDEVEIWTVEGQSYVRTGGRTRALGGNERNAGCGEPRLLERGNLPPLRIILAIGHADRGAKATAEGVPCRMWTAQLPSGSGGWKAVYDICIDRNDLPLEIKARDGSVTVRANRWNEPVAVAVPPVDAPDPNSVQ